MCWILFEERLGCWPLTVRKMNLIQCLTLQGRLGVCPIQEDQTLIGKKAKTKINLHPLLMMGWKAAQETLLPRKVPSPRLLRGVATFSTLALLNFTSLSLGVSDQCSRSRGHGQQATFITSPFHSQAFLPWRNGALVLKIHRPPWPGLSAQFRGEAQVNVGGVGGGDHLLWPLRCVGATLQRKPA